MERNLINIEDYEDYKAYTNNNKEKLIASVREKLKSIDSNYSIYEITAFVDYLCPELEFAINEHGEAFCYTDNESRKNAIDKNKLRKLFLTLRYYNGIVHKPIEVLQPKLGESNEDYEKRVQKRDAEKEEVETKRIETYNELISFIFKRDNRFSAFPELSTKKAQKVLEEAISVGLLDKDYNPTPQAKTIALKSLIAQELAKLIEFDNYAKVFGTLWGIEPQKLISARNKAVNQYGRVRGQKIIYDLFEKINQEA